MTVNLSFINITNCCAEYFSCVSSTVLNVGPFVVGLTGDYLNAFNNSGECGFFQAGAFGQSGWYLQNNNFYSNTITTGVLGAYRSFCGMTVDSCIFSGNTADIGLRTGGSFSNSNNKFKLTNCVFSGDYPSSTVASSSDCKSGSTTASYLLLSRLCPTYSASQSKSKSRSATPPFSPSFPFSVSVAIGHSSGFSATLSPAETAVLSSSHISVGSLAFHRSASLAWTAPLPSSDAVQPESGSSAGLIVGVVISILAVLIGVSILAFVLLRRRRIGRQSSDVTDRSVLNIDFIDDHLDGADDTILTTYSDQVTYEGESQIPGSLPTGFTVNVSSPLIV
jgi:hypothetical protein